jgi:hypothetical protein
MRIFLLPSPPHQGWGYLQLSKPPPLLTFQIGQSSSRGGELEGGGGKNSPPPPPWSPKSGEFLKFTYFHLQWSYQCVLLFLLTIVFHLQAQARKKLTKNIFIPIFINHEKFSYSKFLLI